VNTKVTRYALGINKDSEKIAAFLWMGQYEEACIYEKTLDEMLEWKWHG